MIYFPAHIYTTCGCVQEHIMHYLWINYHHFYQKPVDDWSCGDRDHHISNLDSVSVTFSTEFSGMLWKRILFLMSWMIGLVCWPQSSLMMMCCLASTPTKYQYYTLMFAPHYQVIGFCRICRNCRFKSRDFPRNIMHKSRIFIPSTVSLDIFSSVLSWLLKKSW